MVPVAPPIGIFRTFFFFLRGPGGFFRTIVFPYNDILSNHKPKTSPDYFLVEQSKVTDNLEIANNFNLYFTNIGINLAKDIQTNVKKSMLRT